MVFCTKCGEELPDNAMFCAKCGAKTDSSFAGQAPAWTSPAQPSHDRVPQKTNKALFAVIGASVLVVALVLALVFSLGGGIDLSSPEAAVNSLFSAMTRSDLKSMVKCTEYGAQLTDRQLDMMTGMFGMEGYDSKEEAVIVALDGFLYQVCDGYDSGDIDADAGLNAVRAGNLTADYNSDRSLATVNGEIIVADKTGRDQSYDVEIDTVKGKDGKWYIDM
ncbi:MAG: zinc-ribbon domain-containing protein [Christensenellales bacterium]